MFKMDRLLYNAKFEQNKKNYFKRHFKKALDDHYEFEDFFPPLYQAIEHHKKGIDKEFKKQKEGLEYNLNKAKLNELDFKDNYLIHCLDKKGIVYDDYKKEQNEIYIKEIAEKLEDFTKESVISNRLFGLKLSELILIENALKEAERHSTSNQPQQNEKPLELTDFLHNEQYRDKLPMIAKRFKNAKGKEMATVIYLMDRMDILKYEYGSKTKGRKQLAELLNPIVKMNGVSKYFRPNTKETNVLEADLKTLREWLSGL